MLRELTAFNIGRKIQSKCDTEAICHFVALPSPSYDLTSASS